MGKKKRGNKKKSGRGVSGDKPAADGGMVDRRSAAVTSTATVAGSGTPSISDEEYTRLMMTLPRADERVENDGTGREAMDYFQTFMGASGRLCRDNPAFAERLIGDLFRMGRESEEKHECWICLSDDADESGRPAVRDCSCRGEGLGYAHVDCIKSYAKRASLDMNESVSDKLLPPDELFDCRRFNVHWEKCSICCQPYQHELAKELADSLLQFIAEQFSTGPPVTSYKLPSLFGLHNEMYRDACRMKISAITTMNLNEELRKEGEETARRMLAMVYTDDLRDPSNIALGLKKIGFFLGSSKDTYKEGIKFYERAIEQYKLIGRESSIAIAKSNIEKIRVAHEGQSQMSEEDKLKNDYDVYKFFTTDEGYGKESIMGIKGGLTYAESLTKSGHGIEGERLAIKTLAICDRVLGKMHDVAHEGQRTVEYCQARRVKMLPETHGDAVALCYEDNGRKIVVLNSKGRRMTGSPVRVIFANGTPVVCHSLKGSASHLNGKIGDARNHTKEDGKYTVHFEDKSLEPIAIKQQNLRIIFELPGVDGA